MTSILKVNQIQTTAGAVPTAADLGLNVTGGVLQVIQETSTTELTTTVKDVWHDLAPTVTITPNKSVNKILVSHCAGMMQFESTGSVFFRLLRDSTEVVQIGRIYTALPASDWQSYIASPQYLDSPTTTSAVTYKWQVLMDTTGQIRHNDLTGSFTPTAITLAMEIAG